jgi:hypothetical protein
MELLKAVYVLVLFFGIIGSILLDEKLTEHNATKVKLEEERTKQAVERTKQYELELNTARTNLKVTQL